MRHLARAGSKLLSVCLLVLLIAALLGSAGASTYTIATGTNTSLGTAQPISLQPDLVLQQNGANYTFATAQPVSPTYYGYDVLGGIHPSTPQEFFSFGANTGGFIDMLVRGQNPPTQYPELSLYDNNQNLVAIAAGNYFDGTSSTIQFTVPNGESGTWTAEVSGSPNAPNPATNHFPYDLRFSSPLGTYTTDVFGNLDKPANTGFYSVGANVGDPLHFFVHSTNPVLEQTELLLYDSNGNLVAIASGNYIDGASSVIDFTVPSGDAGNWTIEVAGSPNAPDPNTDLFKYDLLIDGASGTGPVDPLPAPVPEPSSLLLLGTGVLGTLGAMRNKLRRY